LKLLFFFLNLHLLLQFSILLFLYKLIFILLSLFLNEFISTSGFWCFTKILSNILNYSFTRFASLLSGFGGLKLAPGLLELFLFLGFGSFKLLDG